MNRIKRRDIDAGKDKKDLTIAGLEKENSALKQRIVELEQLNKDIVAENENLSDEIDTLEDELETAEDELNSRD